MATMTIKKAMTSKQAASKSALPKKKSAVVGALHGASSTTKKAGTKAKNKAMPAWLASVAKAAERFAKNNESLLTWTDKQLAAAFEVGCFHALLGFYENQGYSIDAKNLKDGVYRYLTSPSGNPSNFSYAHVAGHDGEFEVRQQVRVESHINADIAFTPDIVVLRQDAELLATTDGDFAAGKRRFFRVNSKHVVAAHECKSMTPFPELMVNFVGMLAVAHAWHQNDSTVIFTQGNGHLAPTLFVGGTARGLHLRMIGALQSSFRLNIVCGMHEGTWSLSNAKNRLVLKPAPAQPP